MTHLFLVAYSTYAEDSMSNNQVVFPSTKIGHDLQLLRYPRKA